MANSGVVADSTEQTLDSARLNHRDVNGVAEGGHW
jgi:hypothetical protein